ncbi:hypothetical protein ABER61_22460 [Brevibacillus formosus]|uniref:Uncharacterized protein n=1 Tax=Brevibacillus formosus TaxID=54913 RepID=A0A837KPR9_9BACL|nr:hypothetical protein [Brevibacillus formosus]KLH98696.1 hypothetical protein AA984_17050 [Brevibacillus formosus]MBW5468323.1 hypothetical protein [Brevibacillus formosus]MED1960718.1 hypothetical protein [Brevibacillus formosus]PSJ94146.1 hypothetical protein C7R91_19250 [Brevibacillus formosus]GED61025.1 hypothetical protein BFO01nite_51570 [Brevibacillus formosus]
MIKLDAPILPWIGIGNLNLYSHISNFYPLLSKGEVKVKLLGKFLVRYEVNNSIDLWFNLMNGKLFKLTALSNYTGTLFESIKIGMHIDEVLKIEPSFEYDEFEEVYCSNKGIYIETDPTNDLVLWISVYIKEIENQEFESGNW